MSSGRGINLGSSRTKQDDRSSNQANDGAGQIPSVRPHALDHPEPDQ